jgi:predicted Zn finger-like uncharacterized protein
MTGSLWLVLHHPIIPRRILSMDIRCPNCSKLFRVADEKIAGKGIRFKCSKCAEVITVTKDDFEMDLLARETDATEAPQPRPVANPAPDSVAQTSPEHPPVPGPKAEAREYKPQEYRPAEDQQMPPPSLGDFDFSEPHAAAASAAHPADGFGGHEYTSDASQELKVPEVEISPEAAAEAEAALQFPDDLISDPDRKPAFEAQSAEEQPPALDRVAEPEHEQKAEPEAGTEQEPSPNLQQAAELGREYLPKTGPVFTPPPKQRQSLGSQQDTNEEIDLGAALRIPQTVEPSALKKKESEQTLNAGALEDVHPLASGNLTGAMAGLGCAVPLLTMLTMGFSMMAQFLPFFGALPRFHLLALVGSGIIGMSVMIGIMISIVQARAGRKLFFLVNILIGTVFGAGFGVGEAIMISLVSGAALNVQLIMANAITSAAAAFVLSILVVVMRRIMINEKGEAFSADLSGLQRAGLFVSLVLVLFAVYETGSITGKMEQSVKEAGQKHGEMLTPAGLQVSNAYGYIDPATGDLIVSGSIHNTMDEPKLGWYLVTEVRDAKEAVLTTVKMMNGIQLYTDRERELLTKRGSKAEDIQKMAARREGIIPARGSVDFEVRVMNPPAGSAGFLPTLRAFDPATLGEGR